eukprot:scaffold5440_cov88-Isochrysis_galbana.AAC.9
MEKGLGRRGQELGLPPPPPYRPGRSHLPLTKPELGLPSKRLWVELLERMRLTGASQREPVCPTQR